MVELGFELRAFALMLSIPPHSLSQMPLRPCDMLIIRRTVWKRSHH